MLDVAGVSAGMFSCPWSGNPNGSVPDTLWSARMAQMPPLLDRAATCGARRISLFFNGNRPGMVPLPRDAIVRRLAEVAALAGPRNLEVCVELNDTHHLRDANAILDAVDYSSRDVRLLVDVFHVFRAGLAAAGWPRCRGMRLAGST